MALHLGPILHFQGIHSGKYCVSALLVTDKDDAPPSVSVTNGQLVDVLKIAAIPFVRPNRDVWRARICVVQNEASIHCHIETSDRTGSFHVPALGDSPRMAYGSCNGFSAEKYRKKVLDKPNERWLDMASRHGVEGKEFHLLLLGGDQVYSDSLTVVDGPMKDWSDLWHAQQVSAKWTRKLEEQVDRFFAGLYISRWSQDGVRQILQSIPYVAMWDDHDIIDGWGSHPQDLHECSVYQNLFRLASAYYRLFQQHLRDGETHPAALPIVSTKLAPVQGFSLVYEGLGQLAILVPDLRSERHPDLRGKQSFNPRKSRPKRPGTRFSLGWTPWMVLAPNTWWCVRACRSPTWI